MSEFGQVCMPFGALRGWPLEAVIARKFWYFAWLTRQDLRRYPELAEAVNALAGVYAVAEKLRQYRKQRATQASNRRRFDAWVMR